MPALRKKLCFCFWNFDKLLFSRFKVCGTEHKKHKEEHKKQKKDMLTAFLVLLVFCFVPLVFLFFTGKKLSGSRVPVAR